MLGGEGGRRAPQGRRRRGEGEGAERRGTVVGGRRRGGLLRGMGVVAVKVREGAAAGEVAGPALLKRGGGQAEACRPNSAGRECGDRRLLQNGVLGPTAKCRNAGQARPKTTHLDGGDGRHEGFFTASEDVVEAIFEQAVALQNKESHASCRAVLRSTYQVLKQFESFCRD